MSASGGQCAQFRGQIIEARTDLLCQCLTQNVADLRLSRMAMTRGQQCRD
jgi:hypothetical protein